MAISSTLRNFNARIQMHLSKLRSGGIEERVSPDCEDDNFKNHKKVYEFAAQFVDGKKVLDCGSGNGYGTALLIEKGARSAVGIDYSDDAIAFSQSRYSLPGLSYLKMDAQDIRLPDGSFDFVITTENLEHLPRPEDNIHEIRRLLCSDGMGLIATPNKEISSPGMDVPPNPWHIKEFTYEDLWNLLTEDFDEVHIFESSLESPTRIGQKMKQERTGRGAVGLDGTGGGRLTVNGVEVDLTNLHNTHSFVALVWRPRQSR